MAKSQSTPAPDPTPRRKRRTPEEQLADLERKIEQVKERQEAKAASPEVRSLLRLKVNISKRHTGATTGPADSQYGGTLTAQEEADMLAIADKALARVRKSEG